VEALLVRRRFFTGRDSGGGNQRHARQLMPAKSE